MKAAPLPDPPPPGKKKKKKTDAERISDAIFAEYTLYANSAVQLAGSVLPSLPIYSSRPYGDFTFPDAMKKALKGSPYAGSSAMRFLVMERLPLSFPASFSIPALARATLSSLQSLHSMSLLHCDIKPENFMHRTPDSVVLIDLGLVERYKLSSGAYRDTEGAGRCAGTSKYWSRRYHAGNTNITRYDEVEAVVFVLAEIALSRLPWAQCNSDDDAHAAKVAWADSGCAGAVWAKPVLDYISAQTASDVNREPDYVEITKMLSKVAGGRSPKRSAFAAAAKPAAKKSPAPAKASKAAAKTPTKTPSKENKKPAAKKKEEVVEIDESSSDDDNDDAMEDDEEYEDELYLEFISGPDQGSVYSVGSNTQLAFGRTSSHPLACDEVSSKHCKISLSSGKSKGVMITDLGSTNGTFINSSQLKPKRAGKAFINDKIRVGNNVMVLRSGKCKK
jgi:serine/threonine protein kinase